MMRTAAVAALMVCAVLSSTFSAWGATPRYDVSYLWASRLDNVSEYRQRVARILGPEVTRQLKIAEKPGLYGLIYHRRGSSAGADQVARKHSRLLRARGLESAAPMRSRDWSFVGENAWRPTAVTAARLRPEYEWKKEEQDLESAVEGYIKHFRSKGLIAQDERTAWSVYDFTTGKKLVGINEDLRFQAASLVKPFFAMAFFARVDNGEIIYGSKSRRHMTRMIQHSNNRSTNWVMRYVGGPHNLDRMLKRNYPSIFQDTEIVEYIPPNGRTYKNKASAHDYSRFLHALWQEAIPGAREIKRLMALPGPDRLQTGVQDIPDNIRVYNKTGSTARLCGDMGILVVKGRDGRSYPYTVVGIIEKQQSARNYSSWIRSRSKVIRSVSGLVYQGITHHHRLKS